MRVISGSQGGRVLKGPGRLPIRPTADRVKEALFNVLRDRTPRSRFLDLYAGTGAVGIEALSRGAQAATFVEHAGPALRILRANLEHCGFATVGTLVSAEVTAFLSRGKREGPHYDLVFGDPPYAFGAWDHVLSSLGRSAMIDPQAVVVLEHPAKVALPERVGSLIRFRSHQYGDTALSYYRRNSQQEDVQTWGELP